MIYSALSISPELETVATVMSVLSILITASALLFAIACAFVGWKRGLNRSLLRLATVALTLFIALAITICLKDTINNSCAELLSDAKASLPEDVLAGSPSLCTLIDQIPYAILATFVFGIAFFLINIIFYFAYQGLKNIPIFKKTIVKYKIGGKFNIDKTLGVIVSLVGSFVIILCLSLPLSGYVSFADNVFEDVSRLEKLSPELSQSIDELNDEVLEPVFDNPVILLSSGLGGKELFNLTTSVEISGRKVVWEKEIACILEAVGALSPFMESELQDLSPEGADSILIAVDSITSSDIVTPIASELISYGAGLWLSDSEFLGVQNPIASAPQPLQPLMKSFLQVFASTTENSFKQDINIIANVLVKFIKSGVFSSESDGGSILDSLSSPGFISSIMDTLHSDERFDDVALSIPQIAFSLIPEGIELPDVNTSDYAEFADQVYNELKTAKEKESYQETLEHIADKLESELNAHDIEISYTECILIGEYILQLEVEDGTPSEVIQQYFDAINAEINKSSNQ